MIYIHVCLNVSSISSPLKKVDNKLKACRSFKFSTVSATGEGTELDFDSISEVFCTVGIRTGALIHVVVVFRVPLKKASVRTLITKRV